MLDREKKFVKWFTPIGVPRSKLIILTNPRAWKAWNAALDLAAEEARDFINGLIPQNKRSLADKVRHHLKGDKSDA